MAEQELELSILMAVLLLFAQFQCFSMYLNSFTLIHLMFEHIFKQINWDIRKIVITFTTVTQQPVDLELAASYWNALGAFEKQRQVNSYILQK